MLNNFEILNGEMTPKYDLYNDIYTVNIKEEITKLDIKYELMDSNTNVNIKGNENITKDSIVNIEFNNGNTIRVIKLNVIKENTQTTSGLKEYYASLEVNKKDVMPDYIAPLIGASCFFIIIVVFSILFHKKKKLK